MVSSNVLPTRLLTTFCAGLLWLGTQPCAAQEEFSWQRGWYTDGRSDWYTARDGDRVLMSTATLQPDSTIRGLVFELDTADPSAARSRPYGSNQRWTRFELTFEGDTTFLIDGTRFTRVEVDRGEDFDVRADTPADRWGLYFLLDRLAASGETAPWLEPE